MLLEYIVISGQYYSDFTWVFTPNGGLVRGNPLISGKSRLVKYYSIWPDDMELYHHQQILIGDILESMYSRMEARFFDKISQPIRLLPSIFCFISRFGEFRFVSSQDIFLHIHRIYIRNINFYHVLQSYCRWTDFVKYDFVVIEIVDASFWNSYIMSSSSTKKRWLVGSKLCQQLPSSFLNLQVTFQCVN